MSTTASSNGERTDAATDSATPDSTDTTRQPDGVPPFLRGATGATAAPPPLHPLFPGRTFISTVLDVLDSKETMTGELTSKYMQRAVMAGFFVGMFFTTFRPVETQQTLKQTFGIDCSNDMAKEQSRNIGNRQEILQRVENPRIVLLPR